MADEAEVAPGRFVAWRTATRASQPSRASSRRATRAAAGARRPRQGDHADQRHHRNAEGRAPGGRVVVCPLGALLSRVPFRAGEATYDAPPLFHALGFAHAMLAVGLGSRVILRRRFDPETVLDGIARHRATALVVVPAMLMPILALPEEVLARHDTSSLRIVFCSGAQLEADLASRSLAAFGDTLYNMYGSTEVAYASFATPEDLRAAPGSAGKVPFGAVVQILDERGADLPPGEVGRIFVGNGFQFEGYTGGGTKEVIGGLMSSGDVGHFDTAGRLWIDGRDDEMIVSGGENVFPREVEGAAGHPSRRLSEAAAIGVDDTDWGKRLRAFVGPRPGAEAHRRGRPGLRQDQPRPLQGAAGSGVPRTAAAQSNGQDPEAGAGRCGG